MCSEYKSQDDVILSCMEDAVHRFRFFIDVLSLGQAGKNLNAKANASGTELRKQQKIDKETNAET